MKRFASIVLALLLLFGLSHAALASEEINVVGFWYSEDDDSCIELHEDGAAIIINEDGDIEAEGKYTASGGDVTISAAGREIKAVVAGDSMTVSDDGRVLLREGIESAEVGYWESDADGSAIELYNGLVYAYNEAGDVVGEGTYVASDCNVTIQLDGKTLNAVINDGVMTIDDATYTLLT